MSELVNIPEHFTAELCDEVAPELVEWMMGMIESGNNAEAKAVVNAVVGAGGFRRILAAGQEAGKKHPGGEGVGGKMFTTFCLMVGWKLCERAMVKQLERTKV